MNKEVRKAVRTFLIDEDKVLAIKYKSGNVLDFYDIPGGKIEESETANQASIREFKEETGMDIISETYKGKVIIEYPNRIYEIDIYAVTDYKGSPKELKENYSMWINCNELLQKENVLPSIEILKYLSNDIINLKILVNNNHKIISTEGVMIYKISKEYTETPGSRYINEGKYSAEDFRDNHLIPLIERCKEQEEKLIIDLDGGYGYSTGFLEETFGGLIRKGYSIEDLNLISFVSDEEPELIDTILTYIKEENDRTNKRKLQMWYNNK